MYELAPLIYDLAIMLGLAGIVVLLFQRIHQPVVLGYLVAGVIIGPFTPPYAFVNDMENIRILSDLGVIFLMFSLGLEFSFQKLTRVGMPATITGFIEVILMLTIGYGVGRGLGWQHYDALFLGAALSISSTTIIIKAIEELGLKSKRFAELIFAVLIVEDLLAILLLVALSTLVSTHNVFSFDLFTAALRLIIVVGGWFLIGYFLIVPFFRFIADYISQETLTILSVALCLVLVCLAATLHYSTALGAFIMGSILAETPLIHRIHTLIKPIRDIFAAVFFISVGMMIDPMIIVKYWPLVLLLSAVTIVGKVITTSVGALTTGQSFDRALRTGFGMAQIGEFSFIIITLGLSLEAINTRIYPLIVAVSAITTFTTPYLIRFSKHISQQADVYLPKRIKRYQINYQNWLEHLATLNLGKQKVISPLVGRVVFNGILVAIIFSLIHFLVFHKFELFSENNVNACIGFLLFSLALASPFIWGMLFAHRVVLKPPAYLKTTIILVWTLTFFEILILSVVYFSAWITLFIFALALFSVFIFAFRHLEKSYRWFEHRLVSNINLHEDNEKIFSFWDPRLLEMKIEQGSGLIDKTIRECVKEFLPQKIVGVEREGKRHLNPDKDMRLQTDDVLLLVKTARDE